MPKTKITIVPENAAEAECLIKAVDLGLCIHDIDNIIRSVEKYDKDPGVALNEIAGKIDAFSNIFDGY